MEKGRWRRDLWGLEAGLGATWETREREVPKAIPERFWAHWWGGVGDKGRMNSG